MGSCDRVKLVARACPVIPGRASWPETANASRGSGDSRAVCILTGGSRRWRELRLARLPETLAPRSQEDPTEVPRGRARLVASVCTSNGNESLSWKVTKFVRNSVLTVHSNEPNESLRNVACLTQEGILKMKS